MSNMQPFIEQVLSEIGVLRQQLSELARSHAERGCAFEEATRIAQTHTVLNKLLYIAVENIPLEDMLHKFICEITSLSWLALQAKGAIFLVDTTPGVLELKAHHGMSSHLLSTCAKVPFKKCICGRAAESGEIEFVDHLDERHEVKYRGISPHGHYCVPIISREREVLGVITLYVKTGHRRHRVEEEFLKSAANTLACLVEIKRTNQKLENKAAELERKRRDLDETNTALRVMLNKRGEERLELEEEFILNVKQLIQPYLENLKQTRLDTLQTACIDAVESNLKSILSPFVRTLTSKDFHLTSTELQVVDLVIDGKRTKEIASMLNVSEKTIDVHRRNIRRKLGLRNMKTNLRAHLMSIQK
jgi:DNA-binding CsgD family transcriptional regulator/GAF domain-containing protein